MIEGCRVGGEGREGGRKDMYLYELHEVIKGVAILAHKSLGR